MRIHTPHPVPIHQAIWLAVLWVLRNPPNGTAGCLSGSHGRGACVRAKRKSAQSSTLKVLRDDLLGGHAVEVKSDEDPKMSPWPPYETVSTRSWRLPAGRTAAGSTRELCEDVCVSVLVMIVQVIWRICCCVLHALFLKRAVYAWRHGSKGPLPPP